jgi:branched-chain amino acid transport system substrate-binding protein
MPKPINRGVMNVSRRTLVGGTAASGAALLLDAVRPVVANAQGDAPIRVGMLNSYSKVFAFLGDSVFKGMSLYFDQNGWQIAGRKVELIKEDDEISPQTGLDKARKLVDSDKVDFIFGLVASNVAMAIVPFAQQSKTITFINAGVTSLNQVRSPYIFRTAFSAQQLSTPMGDWLYNNGIKSLVATASDYAAGHDVINEFKKSYVKAGGKILQEIYPPLGTNDYSPYLTQIKTLAPPATYSFYAGADAVRFINQYAAFGLKDTVPMTGWGSLVSADVMGGVGRNAIGCITSSMYTDTLDTPENKDFVQAYHEKFDALPSQYSSFGYTGARVLHDAVGKLNGDTSDKLKVSQAIAETKFQDPRGPFAFDSVTHNPIQNVYVLKTVAAGDKIVNQVVYTATNIRDPA